MKKSRTNYSGSPDDLNLPCFKEPLPEAKKLTMDEYVDFVMENLKLLGKGPRNSVRNLTPVNARFVLD